MKKLLIATSNKDKVPGIISELSGVSLEVLCLSDVELPVGFDVKENAFTFEGNAIAKAIIYGEKTGLLTLADDSGLHVDALDGRPGVLSARYAPGTAENRNTKVLNELIDIPFEKRTARFVSVIAIYNPKTNEINTFEGTCEGVITFEATGENGFGYDPIFLSSDLKITFGQSTTEEKNSVSHRSRAMKKAVVYLKTLEYV